jgi:putative colanic acid biosysnthesis UDP-glucose lipid carrier transferase
MYTQAHSDLNAIRPGMGMFILYGVPLIAASIAGFGVSLEFQTFVAVPALMLVAAIFIVATRGVDTDEVARHQNRFLYVAASATTKALQLSVVVALLFMVMGGSMAAIRAGLLFGMIYTAAMIVLSLLATRLAISVPMRANPRRVTVVAVSKVSLEFVSTLVNDPFVSVDFRGFYEDRDHSRLPPGCNVPIIAGIDGIAAHIARDPIDHVFISLPMEAAHRIDTVVDQLLDSAVSVHYLHDFVAFKPIQESLSWVTGVPVYTVIGRPDCGLPGMVKRGFDMVGSALALIVLAPLLAAVALLIRCESPGPAIFKQVRYGTDGRPFSIYKFRSMTVSACESGNVVQATRGDARVTRLGRFIRKSSIDELPQLFNILRGDMSLVGPRPHAVAHNEHYRGLIRGYMLRHKVRPGLTGWAQVHGLRGETETIDKMESRVRFDLDYLRRWSVALDFYIVLLTVRQVMRGV